MKIGVFGAGYVGLVTATCLAEQGFEVWVYEQDATKAEKLSRGINTIYEPQLTELLQRNLSCLRLHFENTPEAVTNQTDIIFLCVGTPSRPDGSADMSQIESAIHDLVGTVALSPSYKLVVVKSTVPVGTSKWIERIVKLYSKGLDLPIEVASNPEFLREGAAVKDFMEPERIVIGTSTATARDLLSLVYRDFSSPLISTDPQTAEIIKYASNAFLATKISFINMVSDLCDAVDGDVSTVAEAMGYDARIGKYFLQSGAGFGGSCFPKDLRALVHVGEQHNLDFGILRSTIEINQGRPLALVSKLKELLWVLKDKEIAVLGLTFKPETDDVRETPSAKIIELLKEEGAVVTAVDPIGVRNFQALYYGVSQGIRFEENVERALVGKHGAILVTPWAEFTRDLDWSKAKNLMEFPILVDGRSCLDRDHLKNIGFEYATLGRRIRGA